MKSLLVAEISEDGMSAEIRSATGEIVDRFGPFAQARNSAALLLRMGGYSMMSEELENQAGTEAFYAVCRHSDFYDYAGEAA